MTSSRQRLRVANRIAGEVFKHLRVSVFSFRISHGVKSASNTYIFSKKLYDAFAKMHNFDWSVADGTLLSYRRNPRPGYTTYTPYDYDLDAFIARDGLQKLKSLAEANGSQGTLMKIPSNALAADGRCPFGSYSADPEETATKCFANVLVIFVNKNGGQRMRSVYDSENGKEHGLWVMQMLVHEDALEVPGMYLFHV